MPVHICSILFGILCSNTFDKSKTKRTPKENYSLSPTDPFPITLPNKYFILRKQLSGLELWCDG